MKRRVAMITGGNRGLGQAVAAELHTRGLAVVVTAREKPDALEAAAGIGRGVRAEVLDVTDPDGVTEAAARIGEVDILVSNAGVLLDAGSDPLAVPMALVERALAVNLLGSWRVAQAFVPGMVERGWGRVVFVSSGTASFRTGIFPGTPGYSASKTALNALTTMLAKHTEGTGVLVNAVNPGMTRTRMMPRATREPAEAAIDIADAATLPATGPTGAFLRGGTRIEW
ncbi:MAG TPA: SDR family oxidoreductase [Amycolatopsis sp.]|nr:SDR family oxidoreductase [Amycolatopsis sp.]